MNRLLHNGNGKLRYSAADWQGPQHGERGGTYWVNRLSGEKVYSPTNPGGQSASQPEAQSQQQTAKPDMQATAQKYAQIARDKWGDRAHAKLSEKAKALEADPSPEAKRKLAAVKAMREELGQDKPSVPQGISPGRANEKPKTQQDILFDGITKAVDKLLVDPDKGRGGLVSIPNVRAIVERRYGVSREAFDEAVLQMWRDGKIQLEERSHWEDTKEDRAINGRKEDALMTDPGSETKHPRYQFWIEKKQPDKLPGGKSDAIPASAFPPEKVAQGAKVESEHTSDPAKAAEIARDHLAEDEGYYDKLAKMEAKHGSSDKESLKSRYGELGKEIDRDPHDDIQRKIEDVVSEIASLSHSDVKALAKDIGLFGKFSKKAAIDGLRMRLESRWENALNTQFAADYAGDEPMRYEAISLDDLRRMPGPEAAAYAKGVLAMLARQPSLRREFSLQDLAYLEMLARDVDRYAADEG